MAEVAVATALGLLQIIIPLFNKLDLHKDDQDDIDRMESWLSSLKAFIEDNNSRSRGSSTEQNLVDKAAQIVFDIEEVLDQFLFHAPPYTYHHYSITRKLRRQAHSLRHRFPLRGVSKKIGSITKQIDAITKQRAFSNRGRDPGPSSSSTNKAIPLLRDDEFVGYEIPKTQFMRRLVAPEKKLVKIAVDGPAGSGKTTLVKNVVWKRGIHGQFDCHAWIFVSQHPNINKILKNLLKQLSSSRNEQYPPDDGLPIQTRLQRYLSGKKYLVVLDDIWNDEDWSSLKEALPDSNHASRIIVTTRNSNVSSNICSSPSRDHVISLRGLESLDACTLFSRKAFPGNKGERPLEFKNISDRIVERCERLPLPIVTVANALAHKPLHEWETFLTSVSPVDNALQQSYMDLSSSLKCCFLYMSIFPEDYSVERGRLLRLWVAEGFAMATEGQTAEEVAEDNLNELIQRNLVDVSNREFDGRPTNCRLPKFVLDFVIQKCKDDNFASVFLEENTSQIKSIHNQDQMIRRLSLHDHYRHNGDFASVRSMFLFRLPEKSSSDFEKNFDHNLQSLKLIKVLDVQGAPLTEFPKQITNFTLMRYLSFRETKIKLIPRSIKKLSYLETLDLKQTDVTELPQEISHLHNLCYLFVYKKNESNHVASDSVQGVNLHKGIRKLEQLQSLSLVKVDPEGEILVDLKELTRLRKLGLTGLKREHGTALCAAVELMEKLRTLNLCSASMEEYIVLDHIKTPPKTLGRLYLNGRLERFPSWISELGNLSRIRLKWSKLDSIPLMDLGCLPNLTELHLVGCYTGVELTFGASRFEKLKTLVMEELANLGMIVLEDGAMANLNRILLRCCPKLMMLLGGDNLSKLQDLILHDMPNEFIARLRSNGEYCDWVKRIPLVHSFARGMRENLSNSVSFDTLATGSYSRLYEVV